MSDRVLCLICGQPLDTFLCNDPRTEGTLLRKFHPCCDPLGETHNANGKELTREEIEQHMKGLCDL
jgi:hypothetical protein